MKNQKFFIKLMALYVIIIFVYTFISTSIYYYKNNQTLEKELSNNQSSFIKQYSEEIDSKLALALNLMNSFRLDTVLQKYINNTDNDVFDTKSALDEISKNQVAFANLGFKIGFSKLTDNKIISSDNVSNISEYFEVLGITDFQAKDIEKYFSNAKNDDSYLVLKSLTRTDASLSAHYLTVIKEDKLVTNKKFYTFLTFNTDSLLPKLVEPSPDSFLILRDNNIVASVNIQNEADIEQLLKKNHTINSKDNKKLSTKQYDVLTEKSKILNWQYIFISSKNTEKMNLKKLLFGSLTLFLLLTLAGITLGFIILKKMYSPINHILDIFKPFGDQKNGDELTYIKETALKISAANEKLNETIRNNRISLKNKFLRDLLYGLSTKENALDLCERYNIDAIKGSFRIIIMELVNYDHLNDNFSKETILVIQTQLLTIIKEQLHKNFAVELFELDYKRFVLIINETDNTKLVNILRTILFEIEGGFEIPIVAAIGNICNDIYDIEKSYMNALYIIENQFGIGRNAILSIDDMNDQINENVYYPLDVEKDIINNIIRNNPEFANTLLKKILHENLHKRTLSKEGLSFFVFAVVGTINRIIQMLNKTTNDFFEEGTITFVELKMCKSKSELEEKILKAFEIIISKVNLETDEEDHSLTTKMCDYIHQNCHKDISLADIAESFNLSRCYASTIFKKATGQNFKDYLNFHRIEVAKEILDAHPNTLTKELAEKVGFNSSNSFIRAFNKYVGMSPSQYVKQKS